MSALTKVLAVVAVVAGYAGIVWWRLCATTRVSGPHRGDYS